LLQKIQVSIIFGKCPHFRQESSLIVIQNMRIYMYIVFGICLFDYQN